MKPELTGQSGPGIDLANQSRFGVPTQSTADLQPVQEKHFGTGAENNYLIVMSSNGNNTASFRQRLKDAHIPDFERRIRVVNRPHEIFNEVQSIVGEQDPKSKVTPINNLGILDLRNEGESFEYFCTNTAHAIRDFNKVIENFYMGSSFSQVNTPIRTDDKDLLNPINGILSGLQTTAHASLSKLAKLVLNPGLKVENAGTQKRHKLSPQERLKANDFEASIFKPNTLSPKVEEFIPFLDKVFNLTL